jgi:hypothetical protein
MMTRFRSSARARASFRKARRRALAAKDGDNSFDPRRQARTKRPWRGDSEDAHKFSENLNRSCLKLDRHLI